MGMGNGEGSPEKTLREKVKTEELSKTNKPLNVSQVKADGFTTCSLQPPPSDSTLQQLKL